MTAKQINLIQTSWLKLKTLSPEFGEIFYLNFFTVNPDLQHYFSGSKKVKGKKLLRALDTIVESLETLEKNSQLEALPLPNFVELPKGKDIVFSCFLQMAEQQLGKSFTPITQKAWSSVSRYISNTIIYETFPADIPAKNKTPSKGNTNIMDSKNEVLVEKALQVEIADMRSKLDAISKVQAIIEFNMDGTIITANDNFLSTLGYSLDEIQGKHHSMFVEPEYKNSHEYKAFWQSLNRGEFESREYKRLGKGGKEVWIQASYNPVFDENNIPYKVVKFATDVTADKLRNADYSGQIEAISKAQAVIEFNMDGTIITANENFLSTLGYSLGEIQGKHHSMFVEPEFRHSDEYREFWKSLNRGEYDASEYKRTGKGGKVVWIQASYNPIFDLNGKPFKVVKYATDITARKMAIAEIKEVLIALSKGDLSQFIKNELAGEFSIIGDSLNELVTVLADMVAEIRNASTNVFDSAREIAQGNSELSHRTESQASSLEETASAMEELTSTVQQNAENTTEASKLSTVVMDKATNGGSVVRNAITAMSDINKSSKKIADIISVIDEIAFQTNLLALNAAVEAARAGEQGRGFAVVAAEVRNLAQRSAGAAKEIKGLINDSVDAVGQGTKLVDATGQTFEELVTAIEEVSSMINDIDSAGKEQSAGIGEVSAAVSQMDEMTQQNAALVEEAAASSKSMEEQSQTLLEQVKFFNNGEEELPIIVTPISREVNQTDKSPQKVKVKPAPRIQTASDQEWEEF